MTNKTLDNIKNNKGFTLLEIILSLAILSIVAILSITIFTNSFASIFSMGRKSEAVARSEKVLELMYSGQTVSPNGIEINDLSELNKSEEIPGYIISGSSISGFNEVTVYSYYNNGERHVKITTYVPQ